MNQQLYWCSGCQQHWSDYQSFQMHNCPQSAGRYTQSGPQQSPSQQMQIGIPTYITEILSRLDALTEMVQELKDKEK